MNTYLPDWAERKAIGTELCIGRQLATRDGRKLGNAVITGFESKTYANDPARYVLYHVRTDAGNMCKMSESEVNECYYLGDYIMKSVARAIPQDDVRKLMYQAWQAGYISASASTHDINGLYVVDDLLSSYEESYCMKDHNL